MTKFTVKKGKHNFKPDKWCVWWKPKGINFNATFHENANYDLEDADQLDWNKLVGLTWSLDPLKETAMVGWRYNKKDDTIELNAYYHVDRSRDFTEPLVAIKRGESIYGYVIHDRKKKEYQIGFHNDKVANGHVINSPNRRKVARLINPWFGGNERAPQDISLDLNYKRIK